MLRFFKSDRLLAAWLCPAAILLLAVGCGSAAPNNAVPALIAAPTPACRAQLEEVMAGALAAPVTLAAGALTEKSRILMEQRHGRDASGHLPDGRWLGRPAAFSLLLMEGNCFLMNEQSGMRTSLTQCRCRAEPLSPP